MEQHEKTFDDGQHVFYNTEESKGGMRLRVTMDETESLSTANLVELSADFWKQKSEWIDCGTVASSMSDCPLCNRFMHPVDAVHCTGCPIREKTGAMTCTNSLYPEAEEAMEAYRFANPENHEADIAKSRAVRLTKRFSDWLYQLAEEVREDSNS